MEGTSIDTLVALHKLENLEALNISGTQISNLAPISNLKNLRMLVLSETKVADLSPIASLTRLIDGARLDSDLGLHFKETPLTDQSLQSFADLPNPQRTELAINYLREQQGLPLYPDTELKRPGNESSPEPEALEGIPSPFSFKVTERGKIALDASDTNIPAFPFPTSNRDHANQLEAARVLAEDVIAALSSGRYNARSEYLTFAENYIRRLPKHTQDDNMLLADGMARALHDLFGAEAEMLSPGLATLLSSFLKQHIGLCAYYPGIDTFYRTVRDGQLTRPFPLKAAQAFVEKVKEHTPDVFEPPVARAIADARTSIPAPPPPAVDLPPPSSQTILPPPNPGGDVDSAKSRDFATASSANRLWKTVSGAAKTTSTTVVLIKAAHDLAPYASELIDWLKHFLK